MQCCIIVDLLGFAYIVTVTWCIINWCHTHTEIWVVFLLKLLGCVLDFAMVPLFDWMWKWLMRNECEMHYEIVFSILLNNFEILRTIISFPMMLRCSTTKLKSVISCHCNASNTFLNVAGSLKSLLQNYSTALTLSCLRLLSNFWRIHEIL